MARARIESAGPSTRLSDGTIARITRSRVDEGYELEVDGTPQSHVDLGDPRTLRFEYVARMGAVIDLVREPREPITAVHLGAGALTLPRYVEHTRPGSRQQVIELEPQLVSFVREHLPLPRGARIRVRIGDARAVAERLPAGLQGACDLVVSDVFAGAQTPAHLTTTDYFRTLAGLLRPDGIVLVNIGDGPGLAFARRQIATLAETFPAMLGLADGQLLKGRRFGNLVLAASPSVFPDDWPRLLRTAGPFPASVASAEQLRALASGVSAVTEEDATDSPKPSASIFLAR
ncbi:spermidine synthase [Microbacterium sp. No. 7]|uniref:spermidine synthase n=1 Tax=Microbacterium sp. No. 7 TaxID=1714373 RepID=UPI0006D1CFA3|nr:fused MFS/spermidine synthase [Microbacterium sp. No. 7]ALJ18978.1 spermine synthase [Microbacterium sp. No. 7]